MEIKEIGKEGLLERLKEPFGKNPNQHSTSIGDYTDASLYDGEKLCSSALLMEGVDFDLVYFPLNYLGFKSVTVAASGIYGKGGTPRSLSLVLAVSGRFQVEDVEFFMKGVREACEVYGISLVYLDVTSSLTGFAISATTFGEQELGLSQNAQPNELICVTGDLGAAYMGLQLMVREKSAFDETIDFQPDFGGREYILERQLKPVLPVSVLKSLKTNAVNLSFFSVLRNGLTDTLVRIAKKSEVGCRIYEKSLPVDFQTARMAEDFGIEPALAAMHGGEDFQFLFSVPLTDKERVEAIEGVSVIGFTTDASDGLNLVGRSGGATPIRPDNYAN